MGAAYPNMRDMEPDPMEAMSQKTLSSVASDHLNYLYGFMSEVESLESTDPRAGDISDLYFQLVERMKAVLEMRESRYDHGGGPEDPQYIHEDEELYIDAKDAVIRDMRAGTPGASINMYQGTPMDALFQEFYDELEEEYHEIEAERMQMDPSDFDDEVDPERNYISGYSQPEPDYYNPDWGDSMKEDY